MKWDDLRLLRLIDELETSEPAVLSRPFALIERAAREWNQPVNYAEDARLLTDELLLAKDARYLTFNDQGYGGQLTDPQRDPHYWLQQIGDLHLTLVGRDRARGRVVIVPGPDAAEDDGRMVTGATLEEIARAIGETLTASQLPRFLRDSGLPGEFVPDTATGDRWQYVMGVLEALVEDGSAARRSFRTFIGRWLTGQLHTPPPDKMRRRIVALLGQQGWHVKDGVLTIGDRVPIESGGLTALDRDSRIATVHPQIRQVADRFIESDHLGVEPLAREGVSRPISWSSLSNAGRILCRGTPALRKAARTRPSARPMKGMLGWPCGTDKEATMALPTTGFCPGDRRSYPRTQVWKVLGGTPRYTAASVTVNSPYLIRGSSLGSRSMVSGIAHPVSRTFVRHLTLGLINRAAPGLNKSHVEHLGGG